MAADTMELNFAKLKKFEGRNDLVIVLGAGNTGMDLQRHFGTADLCLGLWTEYGGSEYDLSEDAPIPMLIVDFNSADMVRLCEYLSKDNPSGEPMVHRWIFDYSTTKFFSGETTPALFSALVPGGTLLIDSHAYGGGIPMTEDKLHLIQSGMGHWKDGTKVLTGTMWTSHYVPPRIVKDAPFAHLLFTEDDMHQANRVHLEGVGFVVEFGTGYPVARYPIDTRVVAEAERFQAWNEGLRKLKYFEAVKPP